MLREANEAAIQEGERLAVARERARQLRYLHDGALQTLESVGSGRYADVESMQTYARQEAEQLLRVLNNERLEGGTLADYLSLIVLDQGKIGLDVQLELRDLEEPPALVSIAFRDATAEALTNVCKHANTTRAVVRAENDSGGITITVQDFGIGFDPNTTSGFGTAESITQRMAEVGGSATVYSRRGEGTQVKLRWSK